MVLAVPPKYRANDLDYLEGSPRAHSRHGRRWKRGDALGLDNGAHTAGAYWPPVELPRWPAFGPGLPGPFNRCSSGAGLAPCPGSLHPPKGKPRWTAY